MRDRVAEWEEANGIPMIQFCMYCGQPLRSLAHVGQVTWPYRAVCGADDCGAEFMFREELSKAPKEDAPAYSRVAGMRTAHV